MKLTELDKQTVVVIRTRMKFGGDQTCWYTLAKEGMKWPDGVLYQDMRWLMGKIYFAGLDKMARENFALIKTRVGPSSWYSNFSSCGQVWLDMGWLLDHVEKQELLDHVEEQDAAQTVPQAVPVAKDVAKRELSQQQVGVLAFIKTHSNITAEVKYLLEVVDCLTDGIAQPPHYTAGEDLTKSEAALLASLRTVTTPGFLGVQETKTLVKLIDRLRLVQSTPAPAPSPPPVPVMPKVVLYNSYYKFVYGNGTGSGTFRSNNINVGWAKQLFEDAGCEVEVREVAHERLPTNGNGYPSLPKTLAELEDHLRNWERKRRQDKIASLKEELAKLEQEDGSPPTT